MLCEGQRVMFIHDGSHACADVRCNLELDSEFVAEGRYRIIENGMVGIYPAPTEAGALPQPFELSFEEKGPLRAIADFIAKHRDFEVDPTQAQHWLTQSPQEFLKQVRHKQPLISVV